MKLKGPSAVAADGLVVFNGLRGYYVFTDSSSFLVESQYRGICRKPKDMSDIASVIL